MADRAIANEPSGEEQESMFETPERRRGEDDSDVGEINQAGIGVKPLELASTESRGGHMSVFIETVVVPKARSLLSAKMMADWIEASLVQSRNSWRRETIARSSYWTAWTLLLTGVPRD